MRRSRRYLVAAVVAALLLALLSPLTQRIGAESPSDATPAADQAGETTDLTTDQVDDASGPNDTAPGDLPTDVPAPADTEVPPTEVPTDAPTDVPHEVPTLAPTDSPTAPATDTGAVPTARPTDAPTQDAAAPTAAAKPTKAARVAVQATGTGALRVQVVDADGNPLAQSCATYTDLYGAVAAKTVCDGAVDPASAALNDATADGIIDIASVSEGDWKLSASDLTGGFSVAPLPVLAHVTAGKTTDVTIRTHQIGTFAVEFHGAAGQLVTGCAELDAVLGDGAAASGPFTNRFARACDGDDGATDGIAHFTDVPAGTFWVWGSSDGRFRDTSFDFERTAVSNGQSSTVALYTRASQITFVFTDAVTGQPITQTQIRADLIKRFPDGVEAFDNSGAVSAAVGPGTYQLRTSKTEVFTGHSQLLYTYLPAQSDPFTLGVGESTTITLALHRDDEANASPTPSITATATATATSTGGGTGSLRVQVLDADGDPLAASCVAYTDLNALAADKTVCDGSLTTALNDAAADGFVDIAGVPAGDWQLKGSDVSGGYSVPPLPVRVHVAAGQTTTATLYTHRTGAIAVQLRGLTGQPTTGCAAIGWNWNDPSGVRNGTDGETFAIGCDGDDGATDGTVHFANVPPGTYWATGGPDTNDLWVFDYDRTTVANGQTATVTLYQPSSHIAVTLIDAKSGETVTGVTVYSKKLFSDGYEAVDDVVVGPGSYYVFTMDTWINDKDGNSLYVYQQSVSSAFTIGLGETKAITLTLERKEIATPTPAPTGSPTSTPTATATASPVVGHPVCWANRDGFLARDDFKLDCNGYVPGELVTVYLDHTNTTPLATFTADEHGDGTVYVTINHATGGQHTIVWQGSQSTKKLKRAISIQPYVELSVDRGPSGTVVTISGFGYGRNESVAVTWAAWNHDGVTVKTVTSRRHGEVVTKIKIPKADPEFENQISLTGQSGTAYASFVITAPKSSKSTVSKVTSAVESAISAIDIPGF